MKTYLVNYISTINIYALIIYSEYEYHALHQGTMIRNANLQQLEMHHSLNSSIKDTQRGIAKKIRKHLNRTLQTIK